MYQNEAITFDKGWSRIKDEFLDKIESSLDKCNVNDKNQKIIKLKANEYISYYKLVYDMCTQKDSNYSELLYNRLGQSLINYVKTKMCNKLDMCTDNNEKLVLMINEYWMKYKIYTNLLKGIFGYLDRFYVQISVQPTIYEYSMAIFQRYVFQRYKVQMRNYVLDLLDLKRTGNEVDESNLDMIVEMYNKLDSTMGTQYKDELEPYILERCNDYYNKIAPIWLTDLSLLDYIYIIEFCVKDEMELSNQYLNKSTTDMLYTTILTCLLNNQEERIISKLSEISTLIQSYQIDDLKVIYKYINKLNNVNEKIAKLIKDFIFQNLKNNDFEHVVDMYNKYLYMIYFSFENKNELLHSHNDSFKSSINNTQFLNQLLFQFHNHLTKFKYKDKLKVKQTSYEIEMSNHNKKSEESTNSHTENDRLHYYVNIYNLLTNKTDFLRGYKSLMCYRLLYEQTDSEEELKALNKITYEDHVNPLYKMVDDIRKSNMLYLNYVSSDYRNMYGFDKTTEPSMGYTDMIENQIVTVSNLYWPISPNSEFENVKINPTLSKELAVFQDYYKMNNKFKKIEYNYDYSFVELEYFYQNNKTDNHDTSTSVHNNGNPILLICNMIQATLLLMFNKADSIAVQEILTEMNLNKQQLTTLINSFNNLFKEEDEFVVLNQSLLNELDDLNLIKKTYDPFLNIYDSKTTPRLDQDHDRLLDAQSCMDSVIVKIMKRHKKLNRNHFLSLLETRLKEVDFNLTYDEQMVMDRVNVLVHKEYINQMDDFLIYIP